MKVLRSPSEFVGDQYGDFDFTDPGEPLIHALMVCDGVSADRCGCDRSFTGLVSGKATTLGWVDEAPDREVWMQLENSALVASWVERDPELYEVFREMVLDMAESLEDLPLGAECRVRNTPSSRRLVPQND